MQNFGNCGPILETIKILVFFKTIFLFSKISPYKGKCFHASCFLLDQWSLRVSKKKYGGGG